MSKRTNKLEINLRPMKEKDISVAVSIISSHDKFDGKCSRRYYQDYVADPNRLVSKHEQNFVAINSSTGDLIGVCGFAPDGYNTPGIKWLSWFYVAETQHGQGIGSMLLRHTINQLRALGIKKLFLDTSSDPKYARSIEVYQKYGFKIEGDLEDYYRKGESMIIMGLDL